MSEPAEMGEAERRGERQALADQLATILGRFVGGRVEVIVKNDADSKSESPYLTTEEAARYLRIGMRKMRHYVKHGLIPVSRTPSTGDKGNGTLLFDRRVLDKWVADGFTKPTRSWLRGLHWRRDPVLRDLQKRARRLGRE